MPNTDRDLVNLSEPHELGSFFYRHYKKSDTEANHRIEVEIAKEAKAANGLSSSQRLTWDQLRAYVDGNAKVLDRLKDATPRK